MKTSEPYHIIHKSIHAHNRHEILLSIQKLYKQLWKNNQVEHIENHFDTYPNSKISLIYVSNKLVGFGIYHIVTLFSKEILFRSGAVIDPKHRGIGLYKRMLHTCFRFHQDTIAMVCVRTRNIGVYKAMYSLALEIQGAKIYPNIFDTQEHTLPREIQEIMTHFMGTSKTNNIPIAPEVYTKKVEGILQKHYDFGLRDALMIVLKAR